MNMRTKLASALPLLGLLMWLPIQTQAAEDTQLTLTDDSIKEFQRKVMWISPQNSYATRTIQTEITFCPLKGICRPGGSWSFQLDSESTQSDNQHLIQWVGLKRFDQVQVTSSQLSLTTPTGRIALAQPGPTFEGGVKSFEQFTQQTQTVLEQRAQPFGELLIQSLETRAQTLRNKETQTAASTELKTAGLNLDAIKGLMDDGYAFASFVLPNQADITISQVKTIDNYNREVIGYRTTFSLPVNLKMLAYHYQPDTRQFVSYQQFSGNSGQVSDSHTFYHHPSRQQLQEHLLRSYRTAYKAAALSLALEVKRDPQFNLTTGITQTDYWQFEANFNASMDLRVDSLWQITRKVDGEDQLVGLAKAREIGQAPSKGEESLTRFQAIRGMPQLGDQLNEFPWAGVQTDFGFEQIAYHHGKYLGYTPSITDSTITTLRYGKYHDNGYLNNHPDMAEKWNSYAFSLGTSDSGFTMRGVDFSNPLYLGASRSWAKAYYLMGSSVFVMPEFGGNLAVLYTTASDPSMGEDYALTTYELNAHLGISVGVTTSTFSHLTLSVKQPMQLLGDASLKQGNTDVPPYGTGESNFGQGITYSLSYRWNIDNIANAARLMR